MAALLATLTAIASLVVNKPVYIHCQTAPVTMTWDDAVGMTMLNYLHGRVYTSDVYLRYCNGVVTLTNRYNVDTLAHELLHVKHPDWPEKRVYATEHQFAGGWVIPAIRRYERNGG